MPSPVASPCVLSLIPNISFLLLPSGTTSLGFPVAVLFLVVLLLTDPFYCQFSMEDALESSHLMLLWPFPSLRSFWALSSHSFVLFFLM